MAVIPGWSEGPGPESRDSGFDAAHRPGMTVGGPGSSRGDAGEGLRPGTHPGPHHILHKYQPCTASAWPPRPDMVSPKRRFRSPHVTGRNAPNWLRRWRYFADEPF